MHLGEHFYRAVRTLLRDQMPDEADQRLAARDSELGAQSRRLVRAVQALEARRIAEVRDSPDTPFEAELAQLVLELLRERDGSIGAAQEQLPPSAAQRVRETWRQAEDALPHDSGPRAASREGRDLCRASAVREHDVDGFADELPA